MAHYTTELKTICESLVGLKESVGYHSVKSVIEQSTPLLFDFDYPIFDTSYRNVLETKIIKHFYTREIAFETVGLFRLKLETKMCEIMPYYNQLYKSELYEFNPYYDIDLTKTYKKSNDGSQRNKSVEHDSGTDKTDFKQGNVTNDNSTLKANSNKIENSNATGNNETHENGNVNESTKRTDTLNKTGGNTITNTVDKHGVQGGNSTEHTERNMTDKRVENETTLNNGTLTTDNSVTTVGTGKTETETTAGGKDKTTTEQTAITNNESNENSTETRGLHTESDRKTTATNKLLDTPQDNLNLMLNDNYLTSAGTAEGTEHNISDETGTIEKDNHIKGKNTSNTDGTNTTEYGRTENVITNTSIDQTETGNGSQKTDNKTIKGLESTSTGSGGQDTTTTRNLTDDIHETGRQVNELNETDTTNIKSENNKISANVSHAKTSNKQVNETEGNETQKTRSTSKSNLTSENIQTRDNSTTLDANSKINSLEKYVEHITGRNGSRSFALTLQEFRETFLNIDLMVINELNELFFNLW